MFDPATAADTFIAAMPDGVREIAFGLDASDLPVATILELIDRLRERAAPKKMRVKGVRAAADIFRPLGGAQGGVTNARQHGDVTIVQSMADFGRVEIVLVRT